MRIRLDKFGGLVPRLNPESLPDIAAQTANNVDLTSGKLAPIRVLADPNGTVVPPMGLANRMTSQHADGQLKAEIPATEWFTIVKPPPPRLDAVRWLFSPSEVRAWMYFFYIDFDGSNVQQAHTAFAVEMTQVDHYYTDTGIHITWRKSGLHTGIFEKGKSYLLRGPRYRFRVNGEYLPATVNWTDPLLVPQTKTLTDGGLTYGEFQVADIQGPVYDDDLFETLAEQQTRRYPTVDVGVTINLNYTVNRSRTYYYMQTALTADNDEGPPSGWMQTKIKPGQEITLGLAGWDQVPPDVYKVNIYRSETNGDDFLKIGDSSTGSFVDDILHPEPVRIPPYGNYPDRDARVGSVLHPAQFAAVFWGNELWLSDYIRFFAWPKEYTVPFQTDIMALSVTGGSIVVFTSTTSAEPGKVFLISGSNPAAVAKYEVTGTEALLNKLSVCRVNGVVYYVTADGLMALSGASVSLVTKNHYTRKEWQALNPAMMQVEVADDSLFITGGTVNLRVDLQEQLVAITTYTALRDTGYVWKSKQFSANRAWRPTMIRLEATAYPVTVKLYADLALVATVTVTSIIAQRLPRLRPERVWEAQIETAHPAPTVTSLVLAQATEELYGG